MIENWTRTRKADSIYFGGNILTMDPRNIAPEAVAVMDGKILALGDRKEMESHRGENTRMVDLLGKTMMPGFYDAHSHMLFVGLSKLKFVDVQGAPFGPVKNMEDLVRIVKEEADRRPEGEILLFSGYDHNAMEELRHPTRWDLDKATTNHPVFINHFSFHSIVANSKGLDFIGYCENTPDPEGGALERNEAGELTGMLEEAAVFPIWSHPQINMFGTEDEKVRALKIASAYYGENGYTTANQGSEATVDLFAHAVKSGEMKIRCALWFAPKELMSSHEKIQHLQEPMLTFCGAKAFADGSIQLATALLSKPYYTKQPYKEADYKGIQADSQEVLEENLAEPYKLGYQLFVHGNGDQAIENIINAFENLQKKFPQKDPRPTIIHAQTARMDQLERMAELGIQASFFVPSNYMNGIAFRDVMLGPERTGHINPIRRALKLGINSTIHTDAPVMPMDPAFALWEAVTRITRNGEKVGEEEALTMEEALYAMTMAGAIQNKEEDMKGSITAGKWADFVLLNKNPLDLDGDRILELKVMETMVGGETIFSRDKEFDQENEGKR